MKALTIRQPWAHLIVHGPKRVENRTWRLDWRGEIAIHAAKGCTKAEHEDVVDFVVSMGLAAHIPRWRAYPLGAIVGVARITDCWYPAHGKAIDDAMALFDWWDQEQYGIVLSDVLALRDPVPCSGMLGLWTVPDPIEKKVRGSL